MKGISTQKKENSERNSKKEEAMPSQSTLDFLCQFARCYYVEKKLTTLRERDFVLN